MYKRKILLLTLVIVLLAFSQSAHAVLNAVGPVNPANGFPVWYQDTRGVALEQCNFSAASPDPFCLPAGAAVAPIPGIDFDEAFWWAGDALAPNQGNVSNALLVLALEAAFATGDPVAGQQVVFGRVRVRADVAAPGFYTVTHPYGSKTYNVTTPGIRAINDTIDIGLAPLDFAAVLGSDIGPFLKCVSPAPPLGYLGNFAVPCTVTGSPFGTNFFRIQGPLTNTSTSLFSISGKLFTGVLPTPLSVQRTSYSRAAGSGQLNFFATSLPTAVVDVTGGPNLPAAPVVLTGDANGFFFGNLDLTNASVLPATVTVTANRGTPTQTFLINDLTDVVSITKAEYDLSLSRLTIEASSSDKLVVPALTATDFVPGLMTPVAPGSSVQRLIVNSLIAPPDSVEVLSSAGGQDIEDVMVVAPPAITSPAITTGTVGQLYTYQVTATDINAADVLTFSLDTSPLGMVISNVTGLIQWTPAAAQAGANVVTVRVTDSSGLFVTQTFTIIVPPPSLAQAPVITSTPVTTALAARLYTYQVTATDPNAGDVLTFSLATFPGGMTINSATGLVQWTPSSLQAGAQTVTVRVTDIGGLSATQTFTVAVGVNALSSISGTVTDRTGAPLSGVTLFLIGPVNKSFVTGASGAYTFTGLPNGLYEVVPDLAGFRFNPLSRDITIKGVNMNGQNFKSR